MQERHTNKKVYFEEQSYTTREFVIPFVEKYLAINPSTKILEIGCGEGGNLVPFLDKNCEVTGIDISESKIANAREFLKGHPNAGKLILVAKDIYDAADDLEQGYDFVFMRDVIEHIHDQDRFMGYVKKFLKPEGLFFLAFPPWYNPFGGHQQICTSKILSKLPYYHLFPPAIYKLILKAGGENQQKIEALLEIKETGISIERFKKIARKHHFDIIQQSLYFINPNYKVKFGLKPRKQAGIVSAIPYFRNLLTTSVYYIIRQGS
ncbi:MAG: class I SAM-dependent methyltransferase [Bacteroidales bacterium]|nr:class I SAM-dependent methyltransferase [Bacteroidales bacterium]